MSSKSKFNRYITVIVCLNVTLLVNPFLLFSEDAFLAGDKDEYHITLTEKSIGGDFVGGCIACFSPKPNDKLTLPEIDNSKNKYFIDIYVGYEQGKTKDPNDLTIWTMVVPDKNGEFLYIDDNKDKDLTNDAGPYYFPSNQNQFFHSFEYSKNAQQKVEVLLQRNADPNAPVLVDDNGNLIQHLIDFTQEKIPGYEGKKGTFYYNEQLDFSYAMIHIDNKLYKVGIYDIEFNGLYNDSNDLLVIEFFDKNQNKEKRETFKLDEIFKIGDDNYKLSYITLVQDRILMI